MNVLFKAVPLYARLKRKKRNGIQAAKMRRLLALSRARKREEAHGPPRAERVASPR